MAILEGLLQIAEYVPIARELKTNLLVLAIQKHDRSRARLAVIIVVDDDQKRFFALDQTVDLSAEKRAYRVDRPRGSGSKRPRRRDA